MPTYPPELAVALRWAVDVRRGQVAGALAREQLSFGGAVFGNASCEGSCSARSLASMRVRGMQLSLALLGSGRLHVTWMFPLFEQ